jgi:transforming growth factor-beta-induced protein
MIIRNFQDLLNRTALLGVLFISALAFTSCSDDDDDNSPRQETIVATAQGNNNLSALVTALTKFPDLVSTLGGTGQYTVFAPTDAAFSAFLSAIGQENIDDIPEDVLRSVLEYHVIAGSGLKASNLSSGNVETAQGENIAVSLAGGVTLNGSANVVTADVEATNGVVHVIDAVLVPPSITPIVGTIVAPAYFNKNFSTLVAAVVQAGLLQTLLNPDANFTLFAPTNDAFAAAGITALPPNTAEGNEALTSILTYHVLAAEVTSSQLPETDIYSPVAIESLGGEFYLTNKGNGVFLNGNTEVTAVDIQASNGVVHVISRTLLPPDKTIAGIAVEFSNASTPQFTQLVAALSRVPALLQAADNSSATLTVFAPTDEAFQNLYSALGVADLDELDEAFQNLYSALGVADLDELVDEIGVAGLTKVLQHHIVGSVVFSSDLESGQVPTLSGESLDLDLSALTLTDGSNSDPASGLVPSLLNVHATNGVIHVIDKVLIPTL